MGLTRRTACRVCEGQLETVLDFGAMYVSNFPLPGEPDGVQAPLELALCARCSLVQLRHTVSPEAMYRNYWYRSGTNATMKAALKDIATKAETLIRLKPGDVVLDIGCNDGTLLGSYATPRIKRLGFDPAENLADVSRAVADDVICDFFSLDTYNTSGASKAAPPRIVTSIAMFYDLDDPRSFVRDVKEVMDTNGLWVIQMSYLPMMLDQHEFGNICHEHLEYFSLGSLEYLLDLHDMEVVDVELNDVNGGSIRTYVRNRAAREHLFADPIYRELATARTQALRTMEEARGLHTLAPYVEFARWVDRIKLDVTSFVTERTSRGERVFAYGASTKGNTLLQYFGLDNTFIGAAVERNPDKWGRVTVGTRIPIISEEQCREQQPEYMLVLPWHFLREFMLRETAYLSRGGRFIVPMPHFTLI